MAENNRQSMSPTDVLYTEAPSPAHAEEVRAAEPWGLHTLYRDCKRPLELLQRTKELLDSGVLVNYVDDSGSTPLTLLVLHINRGLRYHAYRLPEIAALEDTSAPVALILEKCVECDEDYQRQVYQCLSLVLAKGADCNIIAATCPGIPHDNEWSENYEHKIMQSEQRWNLFTFGATMEFSTFSIFNPLSKYRPTNSKGVTPLHLAAWRGDASSLKMLLHHKADVHMCTTDGRNALHFLYLYCNKPCDLVQCTAVLLQYGIDVNAVDSNGHTPAFVLLRHVHVKISHIRFLANAYTAENTRVLPKSTNHYRDIIEQCLDMLMESGASIAKTNFDGETLLHFLYSRFEHALRDCEEDFQVKGHYLVPYQYRVMPLLQFSKALIKLGCEVNATDNLGRTALQRLTLSLNNLSLHASLNTAEEIIQCFAVLIERGADVNKKDFGGRTALYHLVHLVSAKRHSFRRYRPVLELLVRSGADLTVRDTTSGNSVLHVVLGSWMRAQDMQELLLFLLRSGADPDLPNIDKKFPLNNLMRQHIHHHDPLSTGGASGAVLDLEPYLRTMDLVCQSMDMDYLGYVFSVYRESGFWGVICEEDCFVYKLLHDRSATVRLLRDSCRLVIWRAMGPRFAEGCRTLPLPNELIKYIFNFGSECLLG